MGDIENSCQLPVQGVLESTDECVLKIFLISAFFMFLKGRNPLLIFLLSCHVIFSNVTST